MSHFTVVKPGMLTTVQDLGRWGYQHSGVPVAGAMDSYSHRLANRLAGNADTAAALEITLLGPILEAHGEIVCAVAGAEFELTVGERRVNPHEAVTVASGERLRFGARTSGTRATLAVRGGFDLPVTFGSRATSVLSRMGPFGGRALAAGDELPVGAEIADACPLPAGEPLELPRGGATLRVLRGPHDGMFTPAALDALGRERFVVTPQSNRMGYRLDGPRLLHRASADILSDATPIGSLQVPASGQPILLMADRQTTGGYPRIGTVISADLPLAGQLAPGDWIAFEFCTRDEALAALRQQEARLGGAPAVSAFEDRLRAAFGARVEVGAPLAALTTFRVGGIADWLVTLSGAAELRQALAIAREASVPVHVLGGGSNLLIADAGVRGLVIRIHGGDVRAAGLALVRADAGVTINGLVRWTIARGLAGLEAWAGTPGTVGGAIFGNAHFRNRLISELVHAVTLVAAGGDLAEVPAAAMEFGYDVSRLHRTREIVVSADFHVSPGDPAALREVARESLAFRKRTQPLASPSAGCIFQNPDAARDRVPEGIPLSAGALVDRAGLKGAREGGAAVSPTHANFIVNDGSATAADIRTLVERCKSAVRQQFGVDLREEIVYLGFE